MLAVRRNVSSSLGPLQIPAESCESGFVFVWGVSPGFLVASVWNGWCWPGLDSCSQAHLGRSSVFTLWGEYGTREALPGFALTHEISQHRANLIYSESWQKRERPQNFAVNQIIYTSRASQDSKMQLLSNAKKKMKIFKLSFLCSLQYISTSRNKWQFVIPFWKMLAHWARKLWAILFKTDVDPIICLLILVWSISLIKPNKLTAFSTFDLSFYHLSHSTIHQLYHSPDFGTVVFSITPPLKTLIPKAWDDVQCDHFQMHHCTIYLSNTTWCLQYLVPSWQPSWHIIMQFDTPSYNKCSVSVWPPFEQEGYMLGN